ncbi:MAG: hypothetical protein JWO09_2746 [Bacteroidetes bacterium]|nr:hypothetical protein [Bacteroidota bacterium]
MNKHFYTLFFAALLLAGCTQNEELHPSSGDAPVLQHTGESMPLDEFMLWTADATHGLVKAKEMSDISYNLSYMPSQYMACLELKGTDYTKEELEKASTHYAAMSYFNFRISIPKSSGELLKYELGSAAEYNDRIGYMSFRMEKDLFLVQGKDTLYPGLFHFERIYEIAPYATVMLAFDNEKFSRDKEFTIVYNDALFHKGYIKYSYRPKQLIDLPSISGV